jgi:hypothetical protein
MREAGPVAIQGRPLGVSLVAVLFLLKAAVLASAAGVAYVRPDLEASASQFVVGVAPVSRILGANLAVTLAPFVAVLELAFGAGIWFLRKWAWAWLVVMYGTALAVVALVVLVSFFYHAVLSMLPRSAYFEAGFLLDTATLLYLLTPAAVRAFSESD